MARRFGIVAAALGAFLAAPAVALAVTPKQAGAVAVAALKPGKGAVVYRLPAPLQAGTTVSDGGPSAGRRFTVKKLGPGRGTRLTATIPVTKLTAAGWLFWDDLSDGANFPHTSRLLLVDKRTGKVAWTKTLAWWPLVNGRRAAFYEHSDQPKYRVTAAAGSVAGYAHDCLVALVDATDKRPLANFNGDAAGMLGLARDVRIPAEKATSTQQLYAAMRKLVDNGKCKDVVLFVGGHGTPATQTEQPTVVLNYHVVPTDTGQAAVIDDAVTASDLIDLVEGFRAKASFKILINSCFAGRFVDELSAQPGVELVATAANAEEPSVQWVNGDGRADHPQQAGTYVVGITRELRKILDGQEPNVDAADAKAAQSDMVLALTLAADHSSASGTGTDKAARDGITHPVSQAGGASSGVGPKPQLSPIHAVFTASAVPGCSPPACTTVYTETAKGHNLRFHWTLEIPADPGCAKGFKPGSPNANQATWFHADESEGGPCNHSGNAYDAAGSGHPGTVSVAVRNKYWICTATFHGTQGTTGAPVADGPAPDPDACVQRKH
jgi:hypothetical protein